ncbi:MAG: hypothetical protein NT105_00490 [Verrucomicrobia bacterium]|nr:hypothetical protein [Verrucomicrobiota bacterium]
MLTDKDQKHLKRLAGPYGKFVELFMLTGFIGCVFGIMFMINTTHDLALRKGTSISALLDAWYDPRTQPIYMSWEVVGIIGITTIYFVFWIGLLFLVMFTSSRRGRRLAIGMIEAINASTQKNPPNSNNLAQKASPPS